MQQQSWRKPVIERTLDRSLSQTAPLVQSPSFASYNKRYNRKEKEREEREHDSQADVRAMGRQSPYDERMHRLRQRQKQIDIGKSTEAYVEYRNQVPIGKRNPRCRHDKHPVTPNPNEDCSKRSWSGIVSKWRQNLHRYDKTGEFAPAGGRASLQQQRDSAAPLQPSPTFDERNNIAVETKENVSFENKTMFGERPVAHSPVPSENDSFFERGPEHFVKPISLPLSTWEILQQTMTVMSNRGPSPLQHHGQSPLRSPSAYSTSSVSSSSLSGEDGEDSEFDEFESRSREMVASLVE